MLEKDCFCPIPPETYDSRKSKESKVTLKSLVRLFGEGVTITVKTDDGHILLTPYQLTRFEYCEACWIDIARDNRVIISLVSLKKEGDENV